MDLSSHLAQFSILHLTYHSPHKQYLPLLCIHSPGYSPRQTIPPLSSPTDVPSLFSWNLPSYNLPFGPLENMVYTDFFFLTVFPNIWKQEVLFLMVSFLQAKHLSYCSWSQARVPVFPKSWISKPLDKIWWACMKWSYSVDGEGTDILYIQDYAGSLSICITWMIHFKFAGTWTPLDIFSSELFLNKVNSQSV